MIKKVICENCGEEKEIAEEKLIKAEEWYITEEGIACEGNVVF